LSVESAGRIAAFVQGLQRTGWTDGGNVRLDVRWRANSAEAARKSRRNWSRSRARPHWQDDRV